jgi:hypothetical protein
VVGLIPIAAVMLGCDDGVGVSLKSQSILIEFSFVT